MSPKVNATLRFLIGGLLRPRRITYDATVDCRVETLFCLLHSSQVRRAVAVGVWDQPPPAGRCNGRHQPVIKLYYLVASFSTRLIADI